MDLPYRQVYGNQNAYLQNRLVPFNHLLHFIQEKSDERLKRTNELLQGIKLIKLYGWEDMFYTAISKVRALEILALAKQMGTNVFSCKGYQKYS